MNIPKVGDPVWVLNIGNAARHTAQVLKERVVMRVGRKYFTAGEHGTPEHMWHTFHLDSGRQKSEYSVDHKCYLSPLIWENEKEATEINELIRKIFQYSGSGLSLNKLRQIKSIIEEKE